MPETTIIRPLAAAPRVGDLYGFVDGGRSFAGVVIRVKPMPRAKQHVAVTVELTDREHKRLVLGGEGKQSSH